MPPEGFRPDVAMAIRTRQPSRGVRRVEDLLLDARERRLEIWRRAREIRELLIAAHTAAARTRAAAPSSALAEAVTFVHVMSP
jgi:hypothetical protein